MERERGEMGGLRKEGVKIGGVMKTGTKEKEKDKK